MSSSFFVAMVLSIMLFSSIGHAASPEAERSQTIKEQQRIAQQKLAEAKRDAKKEAARIQREQKHEQALIQRAERKKDAEAKRAAQQQAARESNARRQQENAAHRAALVQQRIDERRKACEPVKGWLEDGPIPSAMTSGGRLASAAALDKAAVVLLSHGRFERAFGRPYENMTKEELFALGRGLGSCFGQPDGPLIHLPMTQRMAASAALNGYKQDIFLQALERVRAAEETLADLSGQLNTLTPNKDDYEKLGQLQSQGRSLLPLGSASAVERFKAGVAAADQRVALPVEKALTTEATTEATGVDGLLALDALQTRMSMQSFIDTADNDAAAGRRANVQAINLRMEEIAAEVADIERRRIDALGEGLTGLERGVQWQADYKVRLAPLSERSKALTDLLRYFRDRRLQLLQESSDALMQALRDAGDDKALQDILGRYLLPADELTVPGTRALTVVAEQRRELEKRAAIGRRPQGGADSFADAGARAAVPDRTQAATDVPSLAPGEPSEETMYDLIRTVLDQGAQKQAQLLSQCRGGGMQAGDPAMNYLCAVVMLGKGLQTGTIDADKPARILKFEKLGCAQAVGKAGYVCDYELAVEKNLNPALVGPQAKRLLEGSSAKQARFLQGRDGWRIFYTEDAVQ